jgi:hypothetical protein
VDGGSHRATDPPGLGLIATDIGGVSPRRQSRSSRKPLQSLEDSW